MDKQMDDLNPFPFTDADIETLETLLFDELGEEALDLFGLHGLVTALQVYPGDLSRVDGLEALIAGEGTPLKPGQQRTLQTFTRQLGKHIAQLLNGEDGFPLPTEIYEDEDAMAAWASGFMEGVYLHEEVWFHRDREEQVASLLLPIMTFSGHYDPDDFQDLQKNPKILFSLLEQIPEVVVDLNLLLNAE